MKIEFIMVHHSAVSYAKNKNQFKANNKYHQAKWNFKSSLGYYLGYNYEIAKNGKVMQARKDGEKTAACYQQDMNSGKCIHICLDGNFDIEKPEPSQIFALRDLLRRLTTQYKLKSDAIVFHRDYAPKTCPGNSLDINFVRRLSGKPITIKSISNTDLKTEIDLKIKELNALIKKL